MSKVKELFGYSTTKPKADWSGVVQAQFCPYINRRCIKVRKSEPDISIGTCTVAYGKDDNNIIICPHRLLDKNQIFIDCIHLLTLHEPGNELHIVSEIPIPGGSVDYFLVSTKDGKAKDFVGIELQTLDTTGTVWPERQRFLHDEGMQVKESDYMSSKPFGMNWKMTAKTILIQMHHKTETFEAMNKHLVLAIQDCFADYMKTEFDFSHIKDVRIGDTAHFHLYGFENEDEFGKQKLRMVNRFSTDANGIAKCLGLKAETRVEVDALLKYLESKLSARTRLNL